MIRTLVRLSVACVLKVVLQGPDGQSITPQEGQQLIIQTPSGQQQVIQSSNGSLVAPDGTVVAPGGTQILGGADAADGGQGILGEESEQVYQTADGQIISAAAAQQLMGKETTLAVCVGRLYEPSGMQINQSFTSAKKSNCWTLIYKFYKFAHIEI